MDISVSVIIAVYNMEKYLKQCLDSVVNQSLKNVEIIAVNDGSTDNSLSILIDYKNKYSNIVIIDQQNQGQAIAKNNAIKIARGKYMIIMDPDDWYPNRDCLKNLYLCAEKNKVSVCGGILIRNQEGRRSIRSKDQVENYFCNKYITVEEYPYLNGQTQFLFSLKLIRDNNILFPDYRRFEDPPFVTKALICAGGFYGINKEVYEYRVGYKNMEYTLEYSIDILSGIADVFEMAYQYNLKNLYKKSLEAVYENYTICKYVYSFCGNEEIDKNIKRINFVLENWDVANKNLMLKKEKVDDYRINCVTEYKKIREYLQKPSILYGGGVFAKRFLEIFKNELSMVKDIAITKIDNNENIYLNGYKVKEIKECLNAQELATVFIVANKENQKEMEKFLCSLQCKNYIKVNIRELELAIELENL